MVFPHAEPWQLGAWAICFHGGPTFSGVVPGVEHSAAAAERTAVRILKALAAASQQRLRPLCDNQPLVQRLQNGEASCRIGDPWLVWADISLAAPLMLAAWIPSHNKRGGWRPPGWPGQETCRQLNAAADAAATCELEGFRQAFFARVEILRRGRQWAERAHKRELEATQPYLELWRQATKDRR